MRRLDADTSRRAYFDLLRQQKEGNRFKDVVADIVSRYGASRSTVKKWWSRAKGDILAAETDLDRDNSREGRWSRMQLWDARSRRYRQVADDALSDKKRKTASVVFEKVALKYESYIAQASGWFNRPLEDDLDDAAVFSLVLNSLWMRLHLCTRDQLIRGAREFQAALDKLAADNPVPTYCEDVEHPEGAAEIGELSPATAQALDVANGLF